MTGKMKIFPDDSSSTNQSSWGKKYSSDSEIEGIKSNSLPETFSVMIPSKVIKRTRAKTASLFDQRKDGFANRMNEFEVKRMKGVKRSGVMCLTVSRGQEF